MLLHCPCCHAQYAAEAAFEAGESREALRVLITAGPLAQPLAAYLGLFRPATRALGWGRAHRLADEVLALTGDRQALAQALVETVEALRNKGLDKPLANHNYLRRVLESVAARGALVPVGAATMPNQQRQRPQSKAGQAISDLETLKHAHRND